jgi:hypothetical protein
MGSRESICERRCVPTEALEERRLRLVAVLHLPTGPGSSTAFSLARASIRSAG